MRRPGQHPNDYFPGKYVSQSSSLSSSRTRTSWPSASSVSKSEIITGTDAITVELPVQFQMDVTYIEVAPESSASASVFSSESYAGSPYRTPAPPEPPTVPLKKKSFWCRLGLHTWDPLTAHAYNDIRTVDLICVQCGCDRKARS